MASSVCRTCAATPLSSSMRSVSGVTPSRSWKPFESTTVVAPRSRSSSTSAGWMPGSWFVPVSFQSHALAPPGKSLASLKVLPSTSRRPQARSVTLGESTFPSIAPPFRAGCPLADPRLAPGRARRGASATRVRISRLGTRARPRRLGAHRETVRRSGNERACGRNFRVRELGRGALRRAGGGEAYPHAPEKDLPRRRRGREHGRAAHGLRRRGGLRRLRGLRARRGPRPRPPRELRPPPHRHLRRVARRGVGLVVRGARLGYRRAAGPARGGPHHQRARRRALLHPRLLPRVRPPRANLNRHSFLRRPDRADALPW